MSMLFAALSALGLVCCLTALVLWRIDLAFGCGVAAFLLAMAGIWFSLPVSMGAP